MPKVAGPNGAGKTTFARQFLPNEARTIQFANADLIATGISPFDPSSANVSAGRVMLKRLRDLDDEGVSFSLETTLSGLWLKDWIVEWRSKGYRVELYYLRVSNVEISIERIKKRVLNGGHNIPEQVARKRFARSLGLLDSVYIGIVNIWLICDCDGEPILVDSGRTDI